MPEILGIENLKQAVKVAISLSTTLPKIKKTNFLVWLGLIDEFRKFVEMVKGRKTIKAELDDLSPDERNELVAYIKNEFTLPNERTEIIIETSLVWAESTIDLIELIANKNA